MLFKDQEAESKKPLQDKVSIPIFKLSCALELVSADGDNLDSFFNETFIKNTVGTELWNAPDHLSDE